MKGQFRGGSGAGVPRDVTPGSGAAQELEEEFATDFSPEELHDFLAADLLESQADPDFKERLRKKLWDEVRLHFSGPTPDGPPCKRDS